MSDRRIRTVAALLLAGYLAVATLAGDPLPGICLCPWQAATGLHCPFCGLTHALYLLGHGSAIQAMEANILAMPFAAAVLVLLGRIAGETTSMHRPSPTDPTSEPHP